MFGLFKKKTTEDLLLNNIEKTIKRVNRVKGGCIQVCMDFVTSTADDDIYKAIGFIQSSHLKNDKTMIMYAALILLALMRTEEIDDLDGLKMQLAESTFVLSNIIVDEDEIKNLMLAPTSILEKRDLLLEKSRSAWSEWLLQSPDILRKVTLI